MDSLKKIAVIAAISILLISFITYKITINIRMDKALKKGEALFKAQKYPQALIHLENLYKKYPKSKNGLTSLYLICQIKKLFQAKGEQSYWEELIIKKNLLLKKGLKNYYEKALLELGKIHLHNREYEKAKEYLKLLLKNIPDSKSADDAVFELATLLKKQNKLDSALKTLQTIIKNYPDSDILDKVQQEIGNVNIALLFSPKESSYTTTYTVKPGDSLASIAKKFNTTVELIKKANNLKKSVIRPFDNLILTKVKFSIVIDKSKNTLTLKADEKVVKIYPVGTGKHNKTPIGTFKVTNKLVDPPWYSKEGLIPPGDKRNLLGTRWLGINVPSYGIHGTTQPETIGSQSSQGCVRMLNKNVEELYSIVPEGTEVVIID